MKIVWGIVILALVGLVAYFILVEPKPGKYDEFAMCLEEEGAVFYGAFWCPHCADQKAEFGRSANKIPYTECSTPDGRSQLEVCNEAGIESYPTWEFADGERVSGVLSLEELADKTSCELPTE